MVDFENRRQRRQLLQHAAPLVDPPHALHQQALRRGGNDVVVLDRSEFDLEGAAAPNQSAVDRLLTAQAPQFRIHDLSVAKIDDQRLAPRLTNTSHAALTADFEGLQ